MHNSIQQLVALSDKNWFKTGGAAQFYAAPPSEFEFQIALNFATKEDLPIFILGEGANILISDEGFPGLVIQPKLKYIQQSEINASHVLVTAGSGVTIADLINYCLKHQIGGLEEFSGIPGSVGGATYINLHYFEFLLSQFLVSAQIIDKKTHQISAVTNDWFEFGYNKSKLIDNNYYLIDATFHLKKLSKRDTAYAQGRSAEIIRHRNRRYPLSHTCGSFFRNFDATEVSIEQNEKKIVYIAYYLDKIGIKGNLTVGGASVSYQHANMIINTDNATTKDIITLARLMQKKVYETFSILPQPECRLVGFAEYPLYKSIYELK
jgi:UDP-N-acetylmuramate dehydrogenase